MIKGKYHHLIKKLIILSLVLCLGMGQNIITPVNGATAHILQNPRTVAKEITIWDGEHQLHGPKINTDGTVVWDCVWFGNYYQSDAEGIKKEPIKWRVLEVNGNDAFLLSDKLLDCQVYNNTREAVKWKDCDLREWLNTTFIDTAFSYSEKIAMWTTPVQNESGVTTYDRVYLMSHDEIVNKKYGFENWKDRNAYRTNYASRGDGWEGYESAWWLRCDTDDVDGITEGENAYDEGSYEYVNWSQMIRPVVHINLEETSEYSYAGTVSNIDNTEWDCVWFGNYYQNDTTGKKKEPIKWRVLQTKGDDAFLISDKKLDVQSCQGTTWEGSSIRKWLNDKFYNAAFSADEKKAINKTLVVNSQKSYNQENAIGQNNTSDYVYLLSLDEAKNSQYGFSDYCGSSITRAAESTMYALEKEKNDWFWNDGTTGNAWWALRNFGNYVHIASSVERDGAIHLDKYTGVLLPYAIRPVIHLNLKNTNVYSYAGTVKADGSKNEVAPNVVKTDTSKKQATSTKKTVKPAKMKIKSIKNVKKRGIAITWRKQNGASGYEIRYSTNKKFKKKMSRTKIVKKKKVTKITIYVPKKKTYYVKLRAYSTSAKGKVYGAWSKVKKVKIKK